MNIILLNPMIVPTDVKIYLNDLRSIKKFKYELDIILFYVIYLLFMLCKFMKDNYVE